MRLFKVPKKRSIRLKRVLLTPLVLISVVLASLVVAVLRPGFGGQTNALSTQKIAFVSNRDGNDQIYIMDSDGSNQTNLSNSDNYDEGPSWSPDGSKIAFDSNLPDYSSEDLYVMNADGTGLIQITHDATDTYSAGAKFSPDGTKIVYSYIDASSIISIHVMNADGSNDTVIADNLDYPGILSWSPDGSRIAFSCNDGSNIQICTMNADGSNSTTLTTDANDHDSASWSPDGSKIAYLTYLSGYITPVSTMNADGSDPTVVPNTSTDNSTVDWSPDSDALVFSGYDTGYIQIFTIHADGTNKEAVTDGSNYDAQPAWTTYSATDVDHDGTASSIEAAAPHSGDANNDGIPDKNQANITSLVSPVNAKYVSLQSSCTSNGSPLLSAMPTDHKDAAYSYPAGLLSFSLSCASGATATVTQYYYGLSSGGTAARKYNATAHTYQAIPGAVISQVTIGGQSVTKVVYSIKDGGSLDQDSTANGTIVDPFGLGVSTVGAPNTGLGGTSNAFAYLKKGSGLVLR